MEMVGSGEEITGEELLRRYAAGERNFPLIRIEDMECILEGANLRSAILWNTNLRGAVFDNAILADAKFTDAKYLTIDRYMTGILFWNTTMPDGTVIEGPAYIN